MKTNFFKKLGMTTMMVLTMVMSCSREESNNDFSNNDLIKETSFSNSTMSSNRSKEDLILSLSEDENFIELGNAMEAFYTEMPQEQNFIDNYNEEQFQSEGAAYFLNLTGYTDQEVMASVLNFQNLSLALANDYPELEFTSENEAFVLEVFESAIAIVEASKPNLPGCRACVKKWKPRMYWSLALGAVAGGLFSGTYQGAWAGATIGFAGMGWALQDCLEDNGC